ncbi:MAG: HAMP domain-containing protein [Acidimicrobiaceae bacterium]|nr:HAMP domain-containing protein [Acidimicrobiaceae bacterium]
MSSPLDDPIADESVTTPPDELAEGATAPPPDELAEGATGPPPDEPAAGDADQSSAGDAPADDGMRPSLGFWSRISTKLYMGIGGAVALTLAASLVGWFSFNRVGDVQRRVNEGSVPELAAAFGVAQYGGILANAAPSLAAATTSMELFQESQQISQTILAFEEQMAVLEQSDSGAASVAHIRESADTLVANIAEIRTEASERFQISEQRAVQQAELVTLRAQVSEVLIPALDDQFFYTLTGYSDLESMPDPRSEHFSEEAVIQYRRLAELEADANITSDLLASAFALTEASLLEPLRERFEAAAGRINRNLLALQETQFHSDAAPIFDRLRELGLGGENSFDLAASEFAILEHNQELLDQNGQLALELVTEVDSLVGASQQRAAEATTASEQAISTARTLLLAISAASVVAALIIIWFFVGKSLVRRIALLSDWMRRMAGGDLEATAPIEGRDEVADMAATLEVFRRHALEVQRLNLVEQLASELQGKNQQLEGVLAELQKAQDQIVTREKLAALGELTAGVAHEIKNPLNFVKNFAEASEELIDELKELLEDVGDDISDENKDYVNEIAGDLTGNIERIRSHGERADRIVRDMLMMGRDSGEWQLTDINGLLEQHAQLSFHSARALDSDFQLDIQQDFDPDVGSLKVIAQDLGRVFLNMVTNAGHATNDRHRAEVAAGNTGFQPTLWLSTTRSNDHVEVRIRDNGTGMPPDVVEKIFNPFFTTKPTNQGTGLGLSISSDIVRRHGGSIAVESEPGEYTEMCITLPLAAPLEAEQAGAGDSWV